MAAFRLSVLLLSLLSLLAGVTSQVCSNSSLTSSGPAFGRMQISNPPTTIPASGTYTAVVSWRSNFQGLLNLHLDVSDITQTYAYDGGAFAQVMGPGFGTVTMQLPLIVSGTGATLSLTDSYQLHTYMTSTQNSTCFGNTNDWLHTIFDGYQAVSTSNAALVPSMTLLNPPTTLPQNGYFLGEVAYTSNLAGYSMLHMDLNDETLSYAYDGGSMLNVTTPGAGVVLLNLTYSQALNLSDVIGIHLYMASGYNYSLYSAGQTNNNDWQHASFSLYYTAQAKQNAQYINSITIANPPTGIPARGNFSVVVNWQSNVTGVINLHCDLSDITQTYAYDGGALVQVVGPGSGQATLTVQITTSAPSTDSLQLHTYMLDEATSLTYQTNAGNNDYLYALYNQYYPVSQLGSSQLCPTGAGLPSGPAFGRMQISNPPTTIPASGTYTAVVSWRSNFQGLLNLHLDVSDITQTYAYDGGAFAQVMGPGFGTVTMQLPLIVSGTGATLSLTDSYQLHTYMTSTQNSTCFGNTNDWLHTIFDGYQAVSTSNAALVPSMTLLNPPTTLPQNGYFLGEVAYTSNLAGYSMLHMDLNDETLSYAYDGGSMLNVTTPGAGVVLLNLTYSQALNLSDVIGIHLYMASGYNYSLYSAGQTNNNDWQHASFSLYYTAQAKQNAQYINSITIANPPTGIPARGNFSVVVNWQSNVTGVINLHCDLSDITQTYAYDGGALVQVVGPGSGQATLTVQITTSAPSTDSLQLHTYMLDEATSLTYQTNAGNNDYLYALYNQYYPVSQLGSSQLCPTGAGLPSGPAFGRMQISNPPTTIPASGTYTAVVSWRSNFQGLLNLHLDVSDITQTYAYDGGAFAQVLGPGFGTVTMQLPLIVSGTGATLSLTDSYQLHTYMTSTQNSTCFGNTNDWLHTIFDGYQAVSTSNAALVPSMTLLNPPTTLPQNGYFLGEVAYTSNLAGYSMLHMDLNDETLSYAYDGGSMLNVTTPGAGVVLLNLTYSQALNLSDVIGIHLYMASGYNYSLYSAGQTNNNDWQHASFSLYYTAQAKQNAQYINSITIANPPTGIPARGNFSVVVNWQSNVTGVINLHCDLSDITQTYAYDGGALVQVVGPGSGQATLTVQITTSAPSTDSLQLHTYMLDEATSLTYQTNAGNNDYLYALYNQYYPVSQLGSSQLCPTGAGLPSGPAFGRMQISNPPTTIPASGTYTAVVSWRSNFQGLLNLHLDVSDITQTYAYDGGAFAQVMGPGFGTVTMQLPLIVSGTGATLSLTDSYQLHTYMTSTQNSTCFGNTNDWLHTIFDGYQAVSTSNAALVPSMTLLNPPTTLPQNGYFLGEVAYTSNLAGYSMLHMDLNDETLSYAYDGGSMLNVTTPGAGVVLLNLTYSQALNLSDVIGIHLYMASGYNYSLYSAGQTNNNDWQHASFSLYYTAQAKQNAQYINSITIANPPTGIPARGNFSVVVNWQSNVTGVINLHCDLSDITQTYAYDGGALVQVVGPGSGQATLTVQITTSAPSTDSLQLHTYMLDEATSLTYQTNAGNNDYLYALYNAYYPIKQTGSSGSPSSSSSSSSGSSGLSGGAIAGIVIGSVAGAALLFAALMWFLCAAGRSGKNSTLEESHKAAGSHMRHDDEVSQSNAAPEEVEMGHTSETA